MDNFDPWQKKFTQGRWILNRYAMGNKEDSVRWEIWCSNIYVGSFPATYIAEEEAQANARLASAAQDLLDVCEHLLADVELGDAGIGSRLFDLAQAATNKAYGYKPQVTIWSHEWQGG